MSYIRASLVLMAALCCKESKTLCLSKKQPYAVAALCCRILKTYCLSNGPTFAVLVKFRIAWFRLLHYWKTATRWPRNAERSKNTARQLRQARYTQSRGTSLEGQHANKITQRFCER